MYSPFPPEAVASAATVRGFRPEEGPHCTAEKFCLDLSGTPASLFNASSGRVFAESFVEAGFACRNIQKVEKMFRSHFKTLKRHYRLTEEAAKSGSALSKHRTKSPKDLERSRYQRKYTVRLLFPYTANTLIHGTIHGTALPPSPPHCPALQGDQETCQDVAAFRCRWHELRRGRHERPVKAFLGPDISQEAHESDCLSTNPRRSPPHVASRVRPSISTRIDTSASLYLESRGHQPSSKTRSST